MATTEIKAETKGTPKVKEGEAGSNGSSSIVPAGNLGLAQQLKFTSLWFPLFNPAVTEAILSKTLYIDFFGANAAAIGLFSIIYAVVGSLSSLYVGILLDNINILPSLFPPGKWGRRAPWLILLIPLYCFTTSLVYNPSAFAGIEQVTPGAATCAVENASTAKTCDYLEKLTRQGTDSGMKVGNLEIYYLITFCFQVIIQSALFATFYGVVPELYPNPLDRGKVGLNVGIFNAVSGIFCVVFVNFIMVKKTVNLTGVVLINVIPLLLLTWPGIKETMAVKFIQTHKKIECKEVLAFMLQRSSFSYVFSTFLHYTTITVNLLFTVFWLTRITGSCIEEAAQLLGLGGLAQLLCGILALPVCRWILVTKEIHPRKVVAIGYIILGIVGFIGIETRKKSVIVPLGALRGIVFAANNLANRMFVGWLADEDMVRRYNKDGKVVRREAFIESIVGWSITGAYLVGGMLTLGLGSTGYNGTLPTRCIESASINFIHFAFGAFSALAAIGRGAVLWLWPLHGENLRKLEEGVLKVSKAGNSYVTKANIEMQNQTSPDKETV